MDTGIKVVRIIETVKSGRCKKVTEFEVEGDVEWAVMLTAIVDMVREYHSPFDVDGGVETPYVLDRQINEEAKINAHKERLAETISQRTGVTAPAAGKVKGGASQARGNLSASKAALEPAAPKIGTTEEVKQRQGYKVGASGHRGVTVRRGIKGARYYTQVFRKGKNRRLGVYDTVEEAVAAVQEELGNKAKAARLRSALKVRNKKAAAKARDAKTQKQAEPEIEKLKGPVKYMCSGCGEDYEKMPVRCVKCQGSAFEKIRPEACDSKARGKEEKGAADVD